MTREEEVARVLYNYLNIGLIECNPEKLLEYISGDVMGFGMGEQGFVSSLEDIRRIMREGVKSEPGVTHRLEIENMDIRFPSETVACVCARVAVLRTEKDSVSKSGLMQTLVLRREAGEWRVFTLHASPVMLSEESIDAYPLKYAENTLAHLKQELQADAMDLMNASISGGILSFYRAGEDRFPLYFVNDSMLEALNYTRAEFLARFQDNIFGMVHPDDRQAVLAALGDSLELQRDYQIRHRVLKRGGEAVWLVARGRVGADEHGRKVLTSVFVDVTEMVEMQEQLERQAAALEAQAKELSVSEERFRIALEKTSNIIFDYDIISGNIMHSSVPKKSMDFVTNINDAPETLIIGGRVLGEYQESFSRAFAAVRNGAPQSSCVVKVCLTTGREIWNKISLTGITDASGKTVRAIGMIEDITRQKEAEIAFAREEQYRQAILADAMASYVINFSQGVFESSSVSSRYCLSVMPGDPYDTVLLEETRWRFLDEDRRAFLNMFSVGPVRERYREGQTECTLEYRVLNGDGTNMWMRTSLHLVQDSVSGELKGFMYVTDIDRKKREELELMRRTEQDPMTGLYNKRAAVNRITELLKTYDGLQSGVFMMLDVDLFKGINDRYGHPAGDKVLIEVARILRDAFREQDVVGRIGGDEFCVFFSGMRSRERVRQSAADICAAVRQIEIPGAGRQVTCSIGVTLCSGIPKSFAQVYQEADQALYSVKERSRDGYALYEKTEAE